MARQAAVKKQQMETNMETTESSIRRRRVVKVAQEEPFVPMLRVDIKTGEFLLDERKEKYWKI